MWTVHEAAFGRPDEAKLVARLRQEARPCVSLVAESAGRVIGHVFFSPVTIEGERPGVSAGGLAPVGVLPGEQGHGAGAAFQVQELAPGALAGVTGFVRYPAAFSEVS